LILNNYFWRQTKESVKDAYVLPGLLEQLVLVQFTDLEKQMYKEASTNGKEKTNSFLFGSTLPTVSLPSSSCVLVFGAPTVMWTSNPSCLSFFYEANKGVCTDLLASCSSPALLMRPLCLRTTLKNKNLLFPIFF
jgi:hypothetical protein